MIEYRQGDVLLIPIENLSDEALTQGKRVDRLILAEGEQTGHVHVLEDVVLVDELFDGRVVVIDEPTPLRHVDDKTDAPGDHEDVMIEPGTYVVRTQREYTGPQETPVERARFD